MSEHFALTKRQKQIKTVVLLAAIAAISEQIEDGDQIKSVDVKLVKDIEQTIFDVEDFMKDFDGTPESMTDTPEGVMFLQDCLKACITGIKDAIS